MANVLSREKQLAVIQLLVEGNSIRSIQRITGVNLRTILRLLVRFGEACRELMDQRMRDLTLRHIQIDEIWTFVAKKERRVRVEERAAAVAVGDMFLWVVLDTDTKLVPTFAVSKRTPETARRVLADLASRLRPLPMVKGYLGFPVPSMEPICQISTDGYRPYPEAVAQAFGPNVKYGTIVKDYRNAKMPYEPSEIVGSKRAGISRISEREKRTICTSHVERNNLTIRTFMKRFTRLSLGFSKKLDNLAAAVAIHFAHYNFCRVHKTLKTTPAVAAGVSGAAWTLDELYDKAFEAVA